MASNTLPCPVVTDNAEPHAEPHAEPTAVPTGNPTDLISIGVASRIGNCHPNTIRNLVKRKKLHITRIGGNGWWRLSREEVMRVCLGVEHKEGDTRRKVAILARVSSIQQKPYLITQTERLKEYVRDNHNEDEPYVFSSIESAWGNRVGLYQCLDYVMENKVSVIVAEYKNRIARSGGLRLLVEHLCKKHNTTIEYVNKEESDPNTAAFDMEELTSYICVLAAKNAGRRSGSRRKIDISTDVMKECWSLRRQGFSSTVITQIIFDKGYRDKNGNKIKKNCLSERIRTSWTALEKLYGGGELRNSFDRWCDQFLQKCQPNGKAPVRVSRLKIVEHYYKWCEDSKKGNGNGNGKGEYPVSESTITRKITTRYKPIKTYKGKCIVYHDLCISTKNRPML